jgi:exonuclease SbcD
MCTRFRDDTVNVVAAHAFVHGADASGSERAAHLSTAYGVPSTVFPANAHYVALGHLHRPQEIPGPCPIRYSGSPLALDFGEAGQQKVVVIVEAAPRTPARITEVRLTSGRELRVVQGTLADLRALAGETGDALLRVHVREKLRVGLADEVRDLFPNAVDVILESPSGRGEKVERTARADRTPHDLFASYLRESDVDDPALLALFDTVYEEATA